MRACFLVPFLVLAAFAADPSLAIAEQSPSKKTATVKHQVKKKFYIRRSSIVQLSLKDMAVWRHGKLRMISDLRMDDRGMFVYREDLKESLAKVYATSAWSQDVKRSKSKKRSKKKVWMCRKCGMALEDQDDLYDHIYREKGLS